MIASKRLPRAATVLTDDNGIMRGYFKGKHVITFGTPTNVHRESAMKWMHGMIYVHRCAYIQANSEIKLTDVHSWALAHDKETTS